MILKALGNKMGGKMSVGFKAVEMRSWQFVEKLKRNGKKGIKLHKEDFIVCCSDSEIVKNPLSKYD
jgi:hypothetical protein